MLGDREVIAFLEKNLDLQKLISLKVDLALEIAQAEAQRVSSAKALDLSLHERDKHHLPRKTDDYSRHQREDQARRDDLYRRYKEVCEQIDELITILDAGLPEPHPGPRN